MVFTHHFMANRQQKKTSMHLGNIVQREGESLRRYVQRFNTESLQIAGLSDDVAYDNFFRGLHPDSDFKFDLVRRGHTNITQALKEAEKYMHAEELCTSMKKKKRDAQQGQHRNQGQSKGNDNKRSGTWAITNKGKQSQSTDRKRKRPEAED